MTNINPISKKSIPKLKTDLSNITSSYGNNIKAAANKAVESIDTFDLLDTYGAEQYENYSKIENLVQSNDDGEYDFNNLDKILNENDKESFINIFTELYKEDPDNEGYTDEEIKEIAIATYDDLLNSKGIEIGPNTMDVIIETLKNKFNGDYEKVLDALSKMTTINEEELKEYEKLIDLLTNKYGMSKIAAETLLNQIDEADCTYVATVNAIFDKFKDNPDLFKEKFGYPLYKEDGQPNFDEMILDLYIYENTQGDNSLLYYDENNKVHISYLADDGMLDLDNQVYLDYEDAGKNISEFLKSKGIDSETTYKESDFDFIEEEFNSGKKISLGICIDDENGETIPMKNISSGEEEDITNLDGSHQVYVTAIDKDTITVASWGEKYEIKKTDLEQLYYAFDATSIDIQI